MLSNGSDIPPAPFHWGRALIISLTVFLLGLMVLLFAVVTQIGVGTGLGLRIDGVLFGATIAGPTVSLWPFLAGIALYPALAGRNRTRVLWVLAPVVLMLLGNGVNALLQMMAITSFMSQFGLGLAVEWTGEPWLDSGGNLPATGGFFLGLMLLFKNAVFDPAAASRPCGRPELVQ
ncbi:MAG: hypothetical protein WA914_05095 [Candidatus Macondimonas sp.]|jgi:hypothetical protein